MNLENFSDFLKEPAHLYRISYQELKGLVLQYPYSLNLRLLLLLKSKMESHPDFEKNLQAAATFALDRTRLWDLLQNPDLHLARMKDGKFQEDVLELKDLSELGVFLSRDEESVSEPKTSARSLDIEKMPPPVFPENLSSAGGVAHEDPDVEIVADLEEILDQTLSGGATPEPVVIPFSHPVFKAEIQHPFEDHALDLAAFSKIVGQLDAELPPIQKAPIPETVAEKVSDTAVEWAKPLPKSAFFSWQKQWETPAGKLDLIFLTTETESRVNPEVEDAPSPSKKKKKKKTGAAAIAEKSLELNEEIQSETLAKLLEKQGNYDRAIKMYEQLILKFPEKSAFFAVQIENLKKNLI